MVPTASIIIPMFNAEKFISATLHSILREVDTAIEVIVANNGSTDQSLTRVREFRDERIRIIDVPRRGAASAMNAGLAEARGSIIMWCDADDLYPDKRVRRQCEWLARRPEYDAVCGLFSTITEKGRLVAQMRSGKIATEITSELANGHIRTSLCTFASRSSFVKRVGLFREFFQSAQDLDYQLRMGEIGRVLFVPEPFYLWRLHSSSITHTQSQLLLEFYKAKALQMQEQRRTGGLDDLQMGRQPIKPIINDSPVITASEHIQGQLLGRAWQEHREGKKLRALRTAVSSLAANPAGLGVWRSALALLVKPCSRVPTS